MCVGVRVVCCVDARAYACMRICAYARCGPQTSAQKLRVPTTTALHQDASVWCSNAAVASQQVEQVRQVERELKSGESQRRPARRRSSPQSAVKFFLFGCVAVHMSTMLYHSILSLE